MSHPNPKHDPKDLECEFCGWIVCPEAGFEHHCGDCNCEISPEECQEYGGLCDTCMRVIAGAF